ncbi:MAG: hypothetical protein KAV41_00840 [Candidatus Pacebacteria bacterium]|nr:hypothetical protein [Candidatus Paceibacterota bacterium]
MQNTKQQVLQTLKIIALALILTTGLSIALAWNGPTAAPPGNNTDEPLNTSNNWQTKYGYLSLPKLIDSNDGQTGYYLDPGANSWLYRLYSYDIHSSIFYDQDNTSYYVDPASTSKFNTINLGGVNRSSWPGVGTIKVNYGDCVFVNHCGSTRYVTYCPSNKVMVAHALYGSVGDDGCGTEWIKCCSLKIE